jgi:hypothetical protein
MLETGRCMILFHNSALVDSKTTLLFNAHSGFKVTFCTSYSFENMSWVYAISVMPVWQ